MIRWSFRFLWLCLDGMIFLHVNSFWRAVPSRKDFSFKIKFDVFMQLESATFITKFSGVNVC